MYQQLLDQFTATIKSSKRVQAALRVITLVARHLLLASLFYLPRCMQARAEGFVQNASHLEEEYHAFWTSTDTVGFTRRTDLPQIQVEWLNDDPIQRLTLRRLAVEWGRHVEYCQSRWTKVLGFATSTAIGLIQVNGPEQNQIFACLVVVRGTLAVLHLVAFHVIVYPRVKNLNVLMKCLSTIDDLCSPLWLSLSLPLASILWFMISILVLSLVLAITFIFKTSTTLLNDPHSDFATSTIFICIMSDAVPVVWIYYRYKQLGC